MFAAMFQRYRIICREILLLMAAGFQEAGSRSRQHQDFQDGDTYQNVFLGFQELKNHPEVTYDGGAGQDNNGNVNQEISISHFTYPIPTGVDIGGLHIVMAGLGPELDDFLHGYI